MGPPFGSGLNSRTAYATRIDLAAVGLALATTMALAATDNDQDAQHTGGTAKVAAIGALAGHELGSGHAAAGAAGPLLDTTTRQRLKRNKESNRAGRLV